MNIYDFDDTIYAGDSTVDFYLFALRRHPGLVMGTIIPNIANGILFKLGHISRQEFKERYFKLFLPKINARELVDEFWQTQGKRVKPWYLAQKQADDLMISASPEFLLAPICSELGVRLIATTVDPLTGEFLSPNCRGEEKVRRLTAKYGPVPVDAFYTDSPSDAPLAALAKRAFVVRGDRIIEWGAAGAAGARKGVEKGGGKLAGLLKRPAGRFALVGGFNTVLDFTLLNALSVFGLPAIGANTVSTGIGMTSSFILNKNYTFRSGSKNHLKDVALFIIFTLVGLWVIQNLVISGLLHVLPVDWPQFMRLNGAKVLGTGVSMVWNYLSYKHVVFRD
jgi:putative flippase GtrA